MSLYKLVLEVLKLLSQLEGREETALLLLAVDILGLEMLEEGKSES